MPMACFENKGVYDLLKENNAEVFVVKGKQTFYKAAEGRYMDVWPVCWIGLNTGHRGLTYLQRETKKRGVLVREKETQMGRLFLWVFCCWVLSEAQFPRFRIYLVLLLVFLTYLSR